MPYEQIAVQEGISASIAELFGMDVSLEMFTSIPVDVTAGIDASRIVILNQSYDKDSGELFVTLSLPEAEITRARVDFCDYETHFTEGHVTNSMDLILDFLESSAASAETSAIDVSIRSGILDLANSRAREEVSLLLESMGVTNVQFSNLEPVRCLQRMALEDSRSQPIF